MDFVPQNNENDVGQKAMGFLNNQNMPPEIQKRIANARVSNQQSPNYPVDNILYASHAEGLTPMAQQALRALMIKNGGLEGSKNSLMNNALLGDVFRNYGK